MTRTAISLLVLSTAMTPVMAQSSGIQLLLPAVSYNAAQTATCAGVVNLSTPLPAGAIVYNCIVYPQNWVGTVTGTLAAPYAIGPVTGNTFTIVTNAPVTTPVTTPPGTITISP